MTLKEKFETKSSIDTTKEAKVFASECEKIADEFAIEFHRWMKVNDTKENSDKYFHYTDKDMLNTFKEEQGL
jgi:hypothetical protein